MHCKPRRVGIIYPVAGALRYYRRSYSRRHRVEVPPGGALLLSTFSFVVDRIYLADCGTFVVCGVFTLLVEVPQLLRLVDLVAASVAGEGRAGGVKGAAQQDGKNQ